MDVLRTPSERFDSLPGYSYQENYLALQAKPENDSAIIRMHYVDYGNQDAPLILMLHGEPSWSYLYRHMIDDAVEAGFRVIAPDLIGFGKSDKPIKQSDYTYASHLYWLTQALEKLDINDIHLICQDWGGLLGLRLVAKSPDKFKAVVAANTMLPTGDHKPPQAFLDWQHYSQTTTSFDIGSLIQRATHKEMIEEVIEAYNAPFPDESYKAGARKFPLLVPITPDDPESQNNRNAWKVLSQFTKPFLTAFSDNDPVTRGSEKIFQKLIPGCEGQAHTILKNGGHFLQEDCAHELISLAITCFKES